MMIFTGRIRKKERINYINDINHQLVHNLLTNGHFLWDATHYLKDVTSLCIEISVQALSGKERKLSSEYIIEHNNSQIKNDMAEISFHHIWHFRNNL